MSRDSEVCERMRGSIRYCVRSVTHRPRALRRKETRQDMRRSRPDRLGLCAAERVDRREALDEPRTRLARRLDVFQHAPDDAPCVHGRRTLDKTQALGVRLEGHEARRARLGSTQLSQLAADLRLNVVGGRRRRRRGRRRSVPQRIHIIFVHDRRVARAVQRAAVLRKHQDVPRPSRRPAPSRLSAPFHARTT